MTDPARSALLVDVRFESLHRQAVPALRARSTRRSPTPATTTRRAATRHALVAHDDERRARALTPRPRLTRTSSRLPRRQRRLDATCATTTGWTGPTTAPRRPATSSRPAQTPLTGVGSTGTSRSRSASARTAAPRADTARAALRTRLRARPRAATRRGWHDYLGRLARPRSAAGHQDALRRLADGDGRARGQDVSAARCIASPSMAWVWGNDRRLLRPVPPRVVARPLPGRHRACSRPATAPRPSARSTTCGPPAEARRLLPAELERRRLAALAEPAARRGRRPDPARLAARPLRRRHLGAREGAPPTASSRRARPRRSAGRTPSATRRRASPPRSPALVCAAEIAERNGDDAAAAALPRGRRRAAGRRRRLDAAPPTARCRPTRTTCALTVNDGNAERRHDVHDRRRRSDVDQRAVVDPSFLELVRLGVKPADDSRRSVSTLPVVDRELGVDTPNGRFWHRYNYDGYGETPDGGPFPGRGQPRPAVADLRRRARRVRAADRQATARRPRAPRRSPPPPTAACMLPEQVWDDHAAAAATRPARRRFSATPLGWTHAQFVRLAWSIDAGPPGRAAVSRRQALPLSHRARAVSVAARGRVAQPAHEA